MDDTTRWNAIHQKTHTSTQSYSKYAEDKEKLFPRNSLVVDLGGGTGEDAMYFLQQGHSVVLVDISNFALTKAQEKAKERGLEKKLVTAQVDYGLHALPVKDDSVDIVYSRIALNYFDREHTIKLFSDIARLLKAGGTAFLSFKSPEDTEEMEYLENMTTLFEPNVFIENGMLRSRFTKAQLEEMLLQAGLKSYTVTPYKEELGERNDGHQQILHLNEISFKKE